MALQANTDHLHSTPVIPVHDMGDAIGFYRGLGFAVREFDPGYARVVAGGHEQIHLRLAPLLDTDANESGVYLHVDNADQRYFAWVQLVRLIDDLGDRPWGMREFSFADPSGNLIRVGHRI